MHAGRMCGPCDMAELETAIASGTLPPDLQIWSPGMKEWTTADEVVEVGVAEMPAADSAVFTDAAASAAAAAATPAAGYRDAALQSRDPADAPLNDAERAALNATVGGGAPHPWRRWFARVVDLTVAGFVLGVAIGILAPDASILDSNIMGTMLVLLFWMLAEPFVLTHFENTPGKALLNIRLRTAEGRSLRLEQAFQRAARVWFFGMAGGLPIVSIFTMAAAYTKLNREGATSWDREMNLALSHGELGTGRVVGIVLFSVAYVLLIFLSALV